MPAIGWSIGSALNRLAESAQVFVPDADPEQPAIVLHHGNASASVGRVDHDVHRAVDREDIAQRAKTGVRIVQVMKHPCANNLVERLAKLPDPLDRKPVELQVSDVVLLLKISGVAQARFADVDRGDARVGLHERMTRGLRRSAPRDKD